MALHSGLSTNQRVSHAGDCQHSRLRERLWTDFRGTAIHVAAILFVNINRWKFATSFFLRLY